MPALQKLYHAVPQPIKKIILARIAFLIILKVNGFSSHSIKMFALEKTKAQTQPKIVYYIGSLIFHPRKYETFRNVKHI